MTIKVFTVADMGAAERAADAAGVSYVEMMETAGRRGAEAIIKRIPVKNQPVLILVGRATMEGMAWAEAGTWLKQGRTWPSIFTSQLARQRILETDQNVARRPLRDQRLIRLSVLFCGGSDFSLSLV